MTTTSPSVFSHAHHRESVRGPTRSRDVNDSIAFGPGFLQLQLEDLHTVPNRLPLSLSVAHWADH